MTDFDEKHGQLVRVAFERSHLLQNPYFSKVTYKMYKVGNTGKNPKVMWCYSMLINMYPTIN